MCVFLQKQNAGTHLHIYPWGKYPESTRENEKLLIKTSLLDFFFFPIFVHLTAKEVAVPLAKLGKEQYLTFTCIEDSFKYLLLSATRKTLFHINKNQAQKAGFQLCIHDLTFRLSVLRHTTFLSPILLDLQKSQLLAIEKGESLLASGLSLQRDWFLSDPPVCLILESLTEVNECEALIRKLKKKKKVKH